MTTEPDHDTDLDTLDALLCEALDGAATDPVRLRLMTMWFFLAQDTDRDADLGRLLRDGPSPVYGMAR